VDGLQNNLYQFLQSSNIDILVVEDSKEAHKAKQIFSYLNKSSFILPDIRVEEFDNMQTYRYELFEIVSSLNKFYRDGGTLITPKSTAELPLQKESAVDSFILSFGDKVVDSELIEKLQCWGYRSVDMVEEMGQYSIHGSVIDIFPIGLHPYRIDRDSDDLIEKIEVFDVANQLSIDIMFEIEVIYINALFSLTKDEYDSIISKIERENFDSLSHNILSFGLWFLEDKGKPLINRPHQVYSKIPFFEEFENINLDDVKIKEQRFKRTSIVLDEIQKGEYVVHSEYGIGIFEEIEQNYVLGGIRDFIKIKYQGDNRLLLPVEKLHLISRYISATGKAPTIDKLGKGGFSKAKEKVQKKLFAIAEKIIEVSAQRKLIEAPKINSFNLKEFQREAGFKYTEDQEKAIRDIIINIQKKYPMDHLLIGDVGFGKTEVALNMIKVVTESNRQVAFIVPTALLAKQHYETAKKRFGDSIRIAHIDRFLKTAEKKKIAQKVETGDIDLIIGTQTIFDFNYRDLGLAIIDEEHRFGVRQKGKLQEVYKNSHHLSMSATPIPRTLHQALSTLKTVSIIETPPAGRKAVRTEVREFDSAVIKGAIHRELQRGGQIFYIFNSIEYIEKKRVELENLIPDIKILILHSKVSSKTMEEEIVKFAKGEYNLLLATSIIGAGLHIPTVNTILIDNADRFGIADLHQFRGRVGRGEDEGFCYFLIEDKNKITENAKKRLLALQESSELGSGATLAQHDLEIRGGGNLIGEAQSGHIDKIGYSLYIKLLEDEIAKQTIGEKSEQDSDIQLAVKGYLSSELIREERVRLDLYRRASEVKSLDEVDKLKREIEDRFGELDTPSEQFLQVIRIKYLSDRLKIKNIKSIKRSISITLSDDTRLTIEAETGDDDDVLKETIDFLKTMLLHS